MLVLLALAACALPGCNDRLRHPQAIRTFMFASSRPSTNMSSTSQPSKFLEICGISVIADVLFAYLPFRDIITLEKVCTSLRHAAKIEQEQRFNINRILRGFIQDCDSLRQILAKSNGLIAGRAVLELFKWRYTSSPYLEILVDYGAAADRLFQQISSHEQYVQIETDDVRKCLAYNTFISANT